MNPVIIIASSNPSDSYLGYLDMEQDTIEKYLTTNVSNEIEIIMIRDATIEKIFDVFVEKGEQIILFHFSGHADSFNLCFEGNIKGKSVNLANLLATAPRLELVFLNGCATAGHIQNFFEHKIKKVIATTTKVQDKTAAHFAIYFYASYCRYWSLANAFDFARNYVLTNENFKYFGTDRFRRINTSFTKEEIAEGLQWGLYLNEKEPGIVPEELCLPGKINQLSLIRKYKPNYSLIQSIGSKGGIILNKLNEQKKLFTDNINTKSYEDVEEKYRIENEISGLMTEITEFEELAQIYKEYNEGHEDINCLADEIMKLLSYPLGGLLRQMIAKGISIRDGESSDYEGLLKLQLNFYDTLVKLCSFTMLSDLCEQLFKNENIHINKIQLDFVKKFFDLSAVDKDEFDYTSFIKTLREILENNNIAPFITEYKDLKDKFKYSESFFESHMLIKGIKHKRNQKKISPGEVNAYCMIVEDELSSILNTVYFILRYKLIAIKSIEILKSRLDTQGTFQHNYLILHKGSSSIIGNKELVHKLKYSDSYSVIITKGLSDITRFLSLSPFMIDRKVQIGDDNSELFFFSHVENGIVFEGVEDPTKKIEIVKLGDNQIPYVSTLENKFPREIKKINERLTKIDQQFQNFKARIQTLEPTI